MFAVNSPFLPCLGSIALFVILFAFILSMRYMNYRETLALAEKGLVRSQDSGFIQGQAALNALAEKGLLHPKGEAKNHSGKGLLITGMVFAAAGLGISLGLLPRGFDPWMILGLVPLFVGLGLVLVYVLTREPKEKSEAKEPNK